MNAGGMMNESGSNVDWLLWWVVDGSDGTLVDAPSISAPGVMCLCGPHMLCCLYKTRSTQPK